MINKLHSIIDKNKSFLLVLGFAGLLFKENYNTLLLILSVLSGLFYFIKSNMSFSLKDFKPYLFILVIPIIAIIGVCWAENYNLAISVLDKNLFFIAIPLLFIIFKPNHLETKKIKSLFSFSVLLYTLVCIGLFISNVIKAKGFYYLDDSLRVIYFFSYTRLSPYIHPTYISLAIVLSLIFLFQTKKKGNIIFIVHVFVQVTFLLFLMARTVQVMFLLGVIILFFSLKLSKKIYATVLLLLCFVPILIFLNPDSTVFNRYTRVLSFSKSPIELAKKNTSVSDRLKMYYIAEKPISAKPFIGYGTGSEKEVMNESYFKYFSDIFNSNVTKLNTHNQYISYQLQWGVLGLFIVLFFSWKNVSLSIKYKSKGYLFFFTICSFLLLTENLFDRQKGILLLIFTSCLLIQEYKTQNLLK